MVVKVEGAKFLQLNVDKRTYSIDLIHDSIKRNEYDFYILQEPFSKRNFWSCPNGKNYKLFTSTSSDDVPRAAIVCNSGFSSLLLSQFSNRDMTVVKVCVESGPVVYMISLYCDSSKCPSSYLNKLPRYVLERCIIGADTNAKSHLWGCDVTDDRGSFFRDFCLNNAVEVVNKKGHGPTYVDNAQRASRIDVTFASTRLSGMIRKWDLGGKFLFKTFHVPITFDATFLSSKARQPVFKHDIKTLDEISSVILFMIV
jgi:hypothetical protein